MVRYSDGNWRSNFWLGVWEVPRVGRCIVSCLHILMLASLYQSNFGAPLGFDSSLSSHMGDYFSALL